MDDGVCKNTVWVVTQWGGSDVHQVEASCTSKDVRSYMCYAWKKQITQRE
jgi:hypothetical protein